MTRDRQVREATDLYSLVSGYVPLRKRGNVAVGKCPWHQDSSPSLTVNLHGHRFAGRWKCWVCNFGGDSQDWLSRIEGIEPFEALKRLAADAGIPLDAPAESPEERRARREEKLICAWWYRERWKEHRSQLNAIMRNGPPETDSHEHARAEYLGQVMRWIERERGTEAGMRVFRAAPVVEGAYREYRTRRDADALIARGNTVSDWLRELLARNTAVAARNGFKDYDEFIQKFGAEKFRDLLDKHTVEIPILPAVFMGE